MALKIQNSTDEILKSQGKRKIRSHLKQKVIKNLKID